ncbi:MULTISPECIES: phage major capsid protein [Pseudobacteroides]|uniref:Phage major capsid protein, HK97 family n=1 Tax=Pseudobacteroides cellulosolvens ATCC 35603 = DSM 2933 TaxID=398512 RepID=A0A0L6JTI6_9FIRM|nr:phage major capsid protein [Pseudobacteroides cellulosolvens]KNY29034.1 phage major capsid protein, HK97 family [Pseudobacteroides cellulosolvens ATCC 35603 = DSM 2933]
MSKILELREKRSKLWEDAKAFLNEHEGNMTAENLSQYEKMEEDIVLMGREIEALERQQKMEMELTKPVRSAVKPEIVQQESEKTGRASKGYNDAFWKNMRSKNSYDVLNALHIGTDSEGGYLVPDEYEKTLVSALEDVNIMRGLATIINTSSGDKQIPVVASRGTASWVAEEGAIPESDDSFGLITLGAHKLATMIKVSEELLNDNVFNLEGYISKEFARRIGAAEEAAFINGNGTAKPTGVIGSGEVGVTAASSTVLTLDEVIDLYYSLREPYRNNAAWLMNDATIKAIRKLKDGNGQYLWQPALQAGQPDTILNRPVKTSSSVPTIQAAAKTIAFGDFKYYWIADRQGRSFQRLNELYAVNGQVGFRATQRVDGKLTLAEAVKVLQMKA